MKMILKNILLKRISFILCIVILFASNTVAGQWQKVDYPFSNYLRVLEIDPTTNYLYAGASSVYRSMDNGSTWIPSNNGITAFCQAMVFNGDKIFVGTNGHGVFRSENNGSSWIPVNKGLPNLYIRTMAKIGYSIFAGNDLGVYLSNDNGDTWTPVNNGLPSTVHSLKTSGTVLYAVSSDGVYRSTNNGGQWNRLVILPGTKLAVSGANIYTDSKHDIILSEDNGNSWTKLNTVLDNRGVRAFLISGNFVFVGTEEGVIMSTDNGNSWTSLNLGLPKVAITSLIIQGDYIFAGTDLNGLWKRLLSEMKVLNLSIGSINLNNSSDSKNFNVSSNTDWIISSNQDWLIVDKTGGTGNATISLTAQVNYGSSPRIATISINGTGVPPQSITVTQAGSNPFVGWTQTNGPSGGIIKSLAIDPATKYVYAGTQGGGVFLSTNNGNSWTGINQGLSDLKIQSIVISGTNIIASTHDGIFLSANNGSTWTEVTSGLDLGSSMAYALAAYENNVFAGLSSGIFQSTNNGISWNLSGPKTGTAFAFALSDANIFAGTLDLGVYLSTNNGSSWSTVNTGLTNKNVNCLVKSGTSVFAGTNGGGVFISTNNGSSWTTVNSGLTNLVVNSLVVSGANIFAGTAAGIFISNTNGSTWTTVNNGLTNTTINSLVVSGTTIFAGTNGGGVFVSNDNGNLWVKRNLGLSNQTVMTITQNDGKVFAGTNKWGAFMSSDDGSTWSEINNEMNLTTINSFAVNGTNIIAGTDGWGVFISNNNGTTWTPINIGLTNTVVNTLALEGGNLFAGTERGIFFSNNNGNTWFAVNTGLTNLKVRSLLVNGSRILAGTFGGGVFLSTNSGNTWNSVNYGLTNLTIYHLIADGSNIFAATDGGIFLTKNYGDSWIIVNNNLTDLNGLPWIGEIDEEGNQTKTVYSLEVFGANIFAGTDGGGVFLSSNNGDSWNAINTGLINRQVKALALSGDFLFAGTFSGSIWKRPLSEILILNVSSNSLTIAGLEGSSASIIINSNINWSISSDQSWLIPNKSNGFSNDNITLTAQANTSGLDRTATIKISGINQISKTLIFTQKSTTTKIDEVDENKAVSIYPNPNGGKFNITIGNIVDRDLTITVTNVLGSIIKDIKIDNSSSSINQEVNLDNMKLGLYFVTIQTKTSKVVKKIIIHK